MYTITNSLIPFWQLGFFVIIWIRRKVSVRHLNVELHKSPSLLYPSALGVLQVGSLIIKLLGAARSGLFWHQSLLWPGRANRPKSLSSLPWWPHSPPLKPHCRVFKMLKDSSFSTPLYIPREWAYSRKPSWTGSPQRCLPPHQRPGQRRTSALWWSRGHETHSSPALILFLAYSSCLFCFLEVDILSTLVASILLMLSRWGPSKCPYLCALEMQPLEARFSWLTFSWPNPLLSFDCSKKLLVMLRSSKPSLLVSFNTRDRVGLSL